MKKLLLMIAGAVMLTSCGFIFQPVDTIIKGKDMAYETTKEIMTGKNAIYNYEWFKQQEADVKRLGEQFNIAASAYKLFKEDLGPDRKSWDMHDKNELARLRANMNGVDMMLKQAIGDYNAKSSMVSRSVFKDNLPSNIQRAMYVAKDMIMQ